MHPELAVKSQRKAIVMVVAGATAGEVEEARGVHYDTADLARIRETYGEKTPTELKRMSDELAYFRPSVVQVVMMLVLLVLGFLATQLIARVGGGSA